MIYLITGLPGNGKTLYTIDYVRKFAASENRPVYYNGISNLSDTLGWEEFEKPEDWHNLPEGSIIIIDECQRTFKPLPRTGNLPLHFSELETHRHHGFDLFLITQHPHLIDTRVRRLCGIHRHIVRAFGTHKAMIHEWSEVHSDCEKNRATSNKTVYFFPKDVFGLYKSAEMHTHKVHVPKVFYYVILCIAAILLCFYMVFRWYGKALNTEEGEIYQAQQTSEQSQESSVTVVPVPSFDRVGQGGKQLLSPEEYINSYIPRIENLPHTAPRYDEVTQPLQAPIITGCVMMHGRCSCYTQQATRVTVTNDFCKLIVREGRMPFYDFLPPSNRRSDERSAQANGVRSPAQPGEGERD